MSHSCYSMVLIMGTNEFNNLKTLITVTHLHQTVLCLAAYNMKWSK